MYGGCRDAVLHSLSRHIWVCMSCFRHSIRAYHVISVSPLIEFFALLAPPRVPPSRHPIVPLDNYCSVLLVDSA
jgi:hypothetical protein